MTTGNRRIVGAFVGGVLSANSLPHLATAATGKVHLTPVGGKMSGRWTNLAWGTANLLGGLALTGVSGKSADARWDTRLIAFDAGAATFAVWMVASEAVLKLNHGR